MKIHYIYTYRSLKLAPGVISSPEDIMDDLLDDLPAALPREALGGRPGRLFAGGEGSREDGVVPGTVSSSLLSLG